MKTLLVTVAGMSTRFSQSLGKACLKCIYYENDIKEALLYRMLYRETVFDRYIIVGGFMFQELKLVIDRYFKGLKDKIILIENRQYAEYGSGYSLYLGMQEALRSGTDELVFAEGDLYIDAGSFGKVAEAGINVITCNKENILASKSVAFYYDMMYGIHYMYDVGHDMFEIKEPFRGIFNSGQVWKFTQPDRMKKAVQEVSASEWRATNLSFIQKYFGDLEKEEYELIEFDKWINCNTIDDFRRIAEVE